WKACNSMVGPEAPIGSDRDLAQQLARLAALEAATSSLRPGLRGILSAAMLVSDRLITHADPKVVRAGETIIKAIQRATERLAETRPPPPP
ncbi:MAG: hypothetical protein M3Z66_10830, partial [Chloroflexota bacterium]|nr:hypothetical protein [Chloroflexota bacterium]